MEPVSFSEFDLWTTLREENDENASTRHGHSCSLLLLEQNCSWAIGHICNLDKPRIWSGPVVYIYIYIPCWMAASVSPQYYKCRLLILHDKRRLFYIHPGKSWWYIKNPVTISLENQPLSDSAPMVDHGWPMVCERATNRGRISESQAPGLADTHPSNCSGQRPKPDCGPFASFCIRALEDLLCLSRACAQLVPIDVHMARKKPFLKLQR